MYLSNVNNIRHKSFYFAGKQQQKTTIKCKNSDLLILCNVKQTLIQIGKHNTIRENWDFQHISTIQNYEV